MIKKSINFIWGNIRDTNFLVLLFVFAELTKVAGFLPPIPDVVTYLILMMYSLYSLSHAKTYDVMFIMLLAYIPLEILITSPDSMFSPWLRYFLFAIIIISCTSLCASRKLVLMRARIFEITCLCCAILGVGSFFAYFLGINYMRVYNFSDVTIVGLFGGLTQHSMLLGPVAGVGTLYLADIALKRKNRILWALTAFCFICVLLSASRSAVLSTIAGILVLIRLRVNNIGKFFKYIVAIFIVFASTMPLWQNSISGLVEKQNKNVTSGSTFNSREDKWEQRIVEFKSSPIFGYGFASVDSANKDNSIEAGGKSIETGSSWLSVLSMTGVVGFFIIMRIYVRSFSLAYQWRKESLLLSVLILLSVNMFTEGYIFFGGSFLAFLFWITIGVCSDRKYCIT